jgi:hypothetical protein
VDVLADFVNLSVDGYDGLEAAKSVGGDSLWRSSTTKDTKVHEENPSINQGVASRTA